MFIHTHVHVDSFFTDFFMRTFYSQSDGHDDRVKYAQKRPNRLTLQHLQIPDVPPSQRPRSGTAERRAVAGSFIPPFSNSRVRDKIVCLSSGMKHSHAAYCYLCMCRENLLVSHLKTLVDKCITVLCCSLKQPPWVISLTTECIHQWQ